MKKLLLSALALAAAGAQADVLDFDSLRVEQLQEVVVSGVRAQKNAPFAIANISAQQLSSFSRSTQELPFLFAQTPGVIAWSENGVGTGTSYLRIRGAGDSRINVTIDGVQLNSPEDQCVFWANMNSYANLLGSVQIQRGVGSSTNGDGAFGGSISLTTKAPSLTPSLELTTSYGSFSTAKFGGSLSSGLLFDHLAFDAAYHHTQTDGFLHGTAGKAGSYYASLTWLNDNLKISYKNIGNYERTGQAWNGVIAGDYDGSILYGSDWALLPDWAQIPEIGRAQYADLYKMGFGRWNSLVEGISYDPSTGSLTATPYALSDGTPWRQTTDNFQHNHNILSAAWRLNPRWSASATLHYTYGYGYYEEFKSQQKPSKFGLPVVLNGKGKESKHDFVRKKGLDQNALGALWNVGYKDEDWNIVGGMNFQHFTSNHFGRLVYCSSPELLGGGAVKYYDSDAWKDDFSLYAKATYTIDEHWSTFADLQYRHVGYRTDGYNDKYSVSGTTVEKNILDIDKRYDFFNPKAGFSFAYGPHRAYASVAMSHREPERNNFTDNSSYAPPVAEQLLDYELGYEFIAPRISLGANFYFMDYADQFVQTGALSDIGEALTVNIPSSYRMGVELTAAFRLLSWLDIEGNAALSQNKLKDFDEIVLDESSSPAQTFHYEKTTLAYSPSFVGNIFLNAHYRGLSATWHTAGVSRQYLDNSESRARSVDGYCVSNFRAAYALSLKRCGVKEMVIGINVNNVFNRHYAQTGFVWWNVWNSATSQRLSHNSYIPSAGTTVVGSLTLRF